MSLEKYGFDREDLVVATAVNVYLNNLTLVARSEVLAQMVRLDEDETVIEGPALAQLIENAKAAAMISAENWKPGEGDYQKALTFIREYLSSVDSRKYIEAMPPEMAEFLIDCYLEAQNN